VSKGQAAGVGDFIRRVIESRDASQHLGDHPQLPKSDLDYCTRIDAFDFAMPIERKDGFLIMRAAQP
jgi:hypothetical protein